jgi:tetratricopeptide (TPR) repeat protein
MSIRGDKRPDAPAAPAEAGRWFRAGNAAFAQGDPLQAASAYERALALAPDHADAWLNLGAAYRQLDRIEEAAACARRVLDLRPDDPRALANLGNALAVQGRLEEAARSYRRSLQIRPDDAETWYNMVNLQPLNDGSADSDADFAELTRRAEASDHLTPREQSALLFALGRALDARGESEAAFRSLARANALHRSALKFDIAASERLAAAIIERFDAALFDRLRGLGSASDRPVFIVGMPRSGGTLAEQIISAHPAVHGAGEIGILPPLVSRIRGPQGAGYPYWAGALAGEDLQHLAQAYLEALEPLGPGKERITDKSVSTFQLLGLVHLCLPNARIIHCRRDPRDVCVSCFSTRFSVSHDYAYDLQELGRYWRLYDRLMAHWRTVLPGGRMLEVDYEALVEDPEAWARRLIAHVGLEWDDACLRFWDSGREVRTASFAQVRRPVFKGSVGRWRRFSEHLGPLLEALGEPWSEGRSA